MGYVKPTPIQQQAIPLILEHKDLIACAQTGTGKTASYLLPVLQHISITDKKHTKALILAPTRELAQQIDQQVEGLAYFAGISSIAAAPCNAGRCRHHNCYAGSLNSTARFRRNQTRSSSIPRS